MGGKIHDTGTAAAARAKKKVASHQLMVAEHLAPTTQGMSDLMVIDGKSTKTPKGWTKLNLDLNKGAGGAWLYLAFQKNSGAESGDPLITRIHISDTGSKGKPKAPAGYTLVRDQKGKVVDLNRGAGGNFLWLSYSTSGKSAPLTDFVLVASTSKYRPRVKGWRCHTVELNEGAGGHWIYLYETRKWPPPAWAP